MLVPNLGSFSFSPNEILQHILFISPSVLSCIASTSKAFYEKVRELIPGYAKAFPGDENFREILSRWSIGCLGLAPSLNSAANATLLNSSPAFPKIEPSQLEKNILTKLQSGQISKLKIQILKTFGLNNQELVSLMHFIENPTHQEVFQRLYSLEQDHLKVCLEKISTSQYLIDQGGRYETRYHISYGKESWDLTVIDQCNMRLISNAPGYLHKSHEKLIDMLTNKRSSKEVVFPKEGCSREELAICIASFSIISNMHLFYGQKRNLSEKSKEKANLYFALKLIKAHNLPGPLKKLFLAEKKQIIVDCALTDEELWQIIQVAKENLQALEILQVLTVCDTIECLDTPQTEDERGIAQDPFKVLARKPVYNKGCLQMTTAIAVIALAMFYFY